MMDTFDWCLKMGEKKEKHKGLRKVDSAPLIAQEHIFKAKHNFGTAVKNKKNAPDWSVSMYFYSAYHCLLALLRQLGYESRNQECTFTCVEYLIAHGLEFEIELIAWVRKTSQQVEKDAKELREEFQYGVNINVSGEVLQVIEEKTKEFIYKTEVLLDKLQKARKTRIDFEM
ncbi:hypothetical protein HZC30_05595 [Candidatus Woesearchaeota archaeon]|nr:hypothetical protein [Candidatus Woesearchaeota archaeon]